MSFGYAQNVQTFATSLRAPYFFLSQCAHRVQCILCSVSCAIIVVNIHNAYRIPSLPFPLLSHPTPSFSFCRSVHLSLWLALIRCWSSNHDEKKWKSFIIHKDAEILLLYEYNTMHFRWFCHNGETEQYALRMSVCVCDTLSAL